MILEIGSRYSFELHTSSYLNIVENGLVTAIIPGEIAEKLGHQVATIHRQVFPDLPKEIANEDFRKQNYYLIQYGNGNEQAIGDTWIKHGTIRIEERNNLNLTLFDITPEERSLLGEVLDAHGFRYRIES